MIEVQVPLLKNPPTILAGIFVPLEDICAGELHLFFRQPIKKDEDDDSRDADFKSDRLHHLGLGLPGGKIAPTSKVVRPKVFSRVGVNHLGVSLANERKSPSDGADINRLPKPIENKNLMVEHKRIGPAGTRKIETIT